MAGQMNTGRERSNAYSIFILVLTVLSLVIMAALVLPLSESTVQLLTVYDNVICVVFLIDFLLNLSRSRPRSDYFIRGRGWLDLLGSIPSFGFFRYTGASSSGTAEPLGKDRAVLARQEQAAAVPGRC